MSQPSSPHAIKMLGVDLLSGPLGPAPARSAMAPLPTGFDPLDLVIDGGLLPGELAVVGGRPGVGKTILALQWSYHFARQDRRVLYLSYEHSEATMYGRLLTLEAASTGLDPSIMLGLRRAIRDHSLGSLSRDQLRGFHPELARAHDEVARSGANLVLASAGRRVGVDDIIDAARETLRPGDVVVVDYLRKVASEGPMDQALLESVEGLKDLANQQKLVVLALASAGDVGMTVPRLRLEHLTGTSFVSHESDIAITLNEKVRATSAVHLAYDLTKVEQARNLIVLSVEKNRRGAADINLEFRKDFANFRFHPTGSFVSDLLVDALPGAG